MTKSFIFQTSLSTDKRRTPSLKQLLKAMF
jgi:hypothetical protein